MSVPIPSVAASECSCGSRCAISWPTSRSRPGGRSAYYLPLTQRTLVGFHDGDFAHPAHFESPSTLGFSAWAISADGASVALASHDGRVWLAINGAMKLAGS